MGPTASREFIDAFVACVNSGDSLEALLKDLLRAAKPWYIKKGGKVHALPVRKISNNRWSISIRFETEI